MKELVNELKRQANELDNKSVSRQAENPEVLRLRHLAYTIDDMLVDKIPSVLSHEYSLVKRKLEHGIDPDYAKYLELKKKFE